jgi:hypothetical protein
MTPEEREKLEAIMVERYMSRVTYGDRSMGESYATMAYKKYSDEALLKFVLNPDNT